MVARLLPLRAVPRLSLSASDQFIELPKVYNGMKKWIVYCWLVALALISAQAMAQETEYQFGVRWSVNGLASSVDIQDIMLDFKGVPSEQSTMLSITQYVRNGRNALQFYAWPVPSAEPDRKSVV